MWGESLRSSEESWMRRTCVLGLRNWACLQDWTGRCPVLSSQSKPEFKPNGTWFTWQSEKSFPPNPRKESREHSFEGLWTKVKSLGILRTETVCLPKRVNTRKRMRLNLRDPFFRVFSTIALLLIARSGPAEEWRIPTESELSRDPALVSDWARRISAADANTRTSTEAALARG